MSNDDVYKGYIIEMNDINSGVIETFNNREMMVFYKIINIDNRYFFAQEITTNCIFPVCFRTIIESSENEPYYKYHTDVSTLKEGKYFIFTKLIPQDTVLGKFKVGFTDSSSEKNYNREELRNYMRPSKLFFNTTGFQKKIKELASKNIFWNSDLIIKAIKDYPNQNDCRSNFGRLVNDCYSRQTDIFKIKNYGYNMVDDKDLCRVVGRDEEIKEIIKCTVIRGKSVILVGEPGSGKSALVETLALLAREGNKWLKDKIIFNLNPSFLLSSTELRGKFEEKINKLINFCLDNSGKIILFIDEIHTLYGLGRTTDSAIDALNILKPYIEKGQIVIIGATTNKEYEEYIMRDVAFCRRLEKVCIDVVDDKTNVEILYDYLNKLENKYMIELDIDDCLLESLFQRLVEITSVNHQLFLDDVKINNPQLVKSLLENAFVESLYNDCDKVTIDDLYLAIINCERLSPTIRREEAIKLKKYIMSRSKKGEELGDNVVSLSLVKN